MNHEVPDIRVVRTRVDELQFPISPPLVLAGRPVSTRDYVVVQVVLENGMTGTAYVLTRGQPIGDAAETVARQALGASLASLLAAGSRHRGTSPHQRARAVFDTCAWDLLGQLHGVPVWRLLGDARARQPLLLVAGYRRLGESHRDFARRLAGCAEQGHRWIKIAAEPEPGRTEGLLAELRELVPVGELKLVVDIGFAGRDVSQVVDNARRWAAYGLEWVEDPVPVAAAGDIAAIRAGSPVPVAAGDEAPPAELVALLERDAVDVLRADSTTMGGLTGLDAVTANAEIPVSLHIYPEIHRHAAFARPALSPVEAFPAGDPFDFVDRFIHPEDWTLRDGEFSPPSAPGFGVHYRPDLTPRQVIRSASFETV